MMERPTARSVREKWRRHLFRAWLAASFLGAIYVGVGGPISGYFSEHHAVVALSVPVLMVFMLASGLGWLILLVTARTRDDSR